MTNMVAFLAVLALGCALYGFAAHHEVRVLRPRRWTHGRRR